MRRYLFKIPRYSYNTEKNSVGSESLCNALYRDTYNALHRCKIAYDTILFPQHYLLHRDYVTSRHRYIILLGQGGI